MNKNFTYDNYKLILNSCLFDEEWYIHTYFKNKDSNINPIFHYLYEGFDKGYNPNSYFNTNFYLKINDDVKRAGMDPLIHYIKYGKNEGRVISDIWVKNDLSLEEKLFYDNANSETLEGYKKIIKYNLFDYKWYLQNYLDVRQVNVNPLIHYITVGYLDDKNPSKLFDTKFYLNNLNFNTDLNPLVHYVLNSDEIDFKNFSEDFELSTDRNIQYLNKKILDLEQQFEQYNDILMSYNHLFNVIFTNSNLIVKDFLRNIQLHTLELLKFIINI